MYLKLKKVTKGKELNLIQQIYKSSFLTLLEKYQDFKYNPACETLDSLHGKFLQPDNEFFFILYKNQVIGTARIIISNQLGRIAPIAIIPDYQGKGLGHSAMLLIEKEHPDIKTWLLDTIKQEQNLVHFYERLGYQHTGQEERISTRMDIIYLKKTLD